MLPQGVEYLTRSSSSPRGAGGGKRLPRRGLRWGVLLLGAPLACLTFTLLLVGLGALLRTGLGWAPLPPPASEVAAQQALDGSLALHGPDRQPPRVEALIPAQGSEAAPRRDVAPAANADPHLNELIRWSLIGIGALLVLLLSVRHPLVARRILILVPTLAILSLVVFATIDRASGHGRSTAAVSLSESGDSNAASRNEELRQRFHFDDPVWKRYLRWLGVNWFSTRSNDDLGLLQGFLGRSLLTGRSVNELVGERIVLTVVISLATIAFSLIVALAIGVSSALRRDSLGGYLCTFIGLLGMSLPPLLLALVLLLAGVPGLFSAESAVRAGWSTGNLIDLLKHAWIIVVVMGVSGAAGLARVLRANLLAELQQPYVDAARARGVRRFRLVLEYPLRAALPSFLSGVGRLFPELVSASAIVGIVLSLPLVGPLQLEALVKGDAYLAGSMLMVLSLLSVFGTLLADLLSLWFNPRIGHQKGVA